MNDLISLAIGLFVGMIYGALYLRSPAPPAIALGKPEELGAQINAVFKGGADVIFDTTGFWLPAAVAGLAPFGRIAIIAAPVDGHVQLPALALYRRAARWRGSIRCSTTASSAR